MSLIDLMANKEDIESWLSICVFIERHFYGTETNIFYTMEGGFLVEWKSKQGEFCMRLWPPEEGQMTIEFHAVTQKEYYDWDIYPSNIERHFKKVIDKVLLHYGLR